MSFVDLATLALHRRSEMEERIKIFHEKCDQAMHGIQKLKIHTHGFIGELNCDPIHLKEKFLKYMKQLDELNYLITDFNLALGQFDTISTLEPTPVHDTAPRMLESPHYNLMDALIEPSPSTSTACRNHCPSEKLKTKRISKKDQVLIAFSSSSTSSESMGCNKKLTPEKGIIQATEVDLVEQMNLVNIDGANAASKPKLPPQRVLEERKYRGIIMNMDAVVFWAIIDDLKEAMSIMQDMDEYYRNNRASIPKLDVQPESICAYYDDETDAYYRAFLVPSSCVDKDVYEVFLVDTGEKRSAHARDLFPLLPQFCVVPPLARLCYLAGIELLCNNRREAIEETEKLLQEFVGEADIIIDDNTSDSLGVYVSSDNCDVTLNQLLVQRGLATEIDKPQEVYREQMSPPQEVYRAQLSPAQGPPELLQDSVSESDIAIQPEYDDPVEAVMGYSCRDNADICKNYKGGPEKKCFKKRCNKRHVLPHPDGWTLDQVPVQVVSKLKLPPLPAPGTTIRVHVTCVCHFDRVWVQMPSGNDQCNEVRAFGDIRPLTTLEALVRDMNCDATRQAYRPLKLAPAPGELVAAMYTDQRWYRAKVVNTVRADQCVEVMYIDYGNVMWVKEDAIRVLEPRFTTLPIQAVLCRLAGVSALVDDSKKWAEAKLVLTQMTLDQGLEAYVVERHYDELTIELYDESGYSIAQQMAARSLVALEEYRVQSDDHVTVKVVVP